VVLLFRLAFLPDVIFFRLMIRAVACVLVGCYTKGTSRSIWNEHHWLYTSVCVPVPPLLVHLLFTAHCALLDIVCHTCQALGSAVSAVGKGSLGQECRH